MSVAKNRECNVLKLTNCREIKVVKTLIALTLLITLTGCAAWTPVKYAADKVCDASPV